MTTRSLLCLVLVLALSKPTTAQGVNVDIGVASPGPSASFGAAAGQPGVWNAVSGAASGPVALVNLAGSASAVTLTRTSGSASDVAVDNPGTSGNDELLMDDITYPLTTSTWTIGGLAAGTYGVTTYAWAPDNALYVTGVVVNGNAPTNVGGAWPGSFVLGTTHAFDNVTIPAAGTITITLSAFASFASFNGFQIKPGATPAVGYCFGDGTDTACPCGNAGVAGRGCNNTAASGGAGLFSAGVASVSGDTLVLIGGRAIPFGPGLYFQGSTPANPAAPFGIATGNGLRCAGGVTSRLGIRIADAMGTSMTAAPIHLLGSTAPGDNRNYQLWYRDTPDFGACTSGFNWSSGLNLTWGP